MNNTIDKKIEDVIQNNMMGYASYVLLERCLPDLRDGMKPVYRRILYSMHIMKATRFTKSANVAGQVMRLHPHGSSYGTMVGMVQPDRNAIPFVEGKGNFGNYTSRDLDAGAERYTEVRLSPIATEMMKNFEKKLVKFRDNYDGTMTEPEALPVKFPAILTQAQSGIGVGFSSSTASYNLNELVDAMIKFIETKEHTILVPDFATGGTILNDTESFEKINIEGRGTVRLKGVATIDGNEILITEIPYATTREAIIEKIVELARTNKLKEVSDVKDLTGLKGMLISVTAKRGTDMNLLLEKLYQFTPLQSTYSSNMNFLVDGLPKVMGVHATIEKWLEWRRSCIQRGLEYDVDKMTKQLHLLRGLEKVLVDIDKAIDIIRKSKAELIEKNLMKHFEIDEVQAIEVANMKLRNINKDYIVKKIKDIAQLAKDIVKYNKMIGNEKALNKIVIEGLLETKEKYGSPRRTKIVKPTSQVKIALIQEEIENYPVKIHLTEDGYIFKFKNSNQEPSLKIGDKVTKVFETENTSTLLVFGENKVCYKIPMSEIEETKAGNLGTYLQTMMRDKVEIVNYSIVDDKQKFIIAAYKNNRIAKVNIESYKYGKNILKNSICLKQDLLDLITFENEGKLKITTDRDEIVINTKDLSMTNGRAATGSFVNGRRIMKNIEVIS